jgi:hydrogenase maturation protease
LRCAVIGIGNADRGDDAAGMIAARQLANQLPPEVKILEHDGEVASLISCLEGMEAVFLIDACQSGAPPGTVHRFDANSAPLPQGAFKMSTHAMGLADAIELARALQQLPACCVIYGIEAEMFETGASLSARVESAVPLVAERLADEIGRLPKHLPFA